MNSRPAVLRFLVGLFVLLPGLRAAAQTGAALVRHAPSINGIVEGSVQQMTGEQTVLNSGAAITLDLLVPGTPNVVRNNPVVYGGTVDGTGGAAPGGYTIVLNSGSTLRHVVRRTNPAALPTVAAPPAPTGTRDVTINSAGQSAGNFSTLRNLTLNGGGLIAVPPGTYGAFIANSGTGFTLGIAGAAQPAIYNLQRLTLNSGAQLRVVGPVVLTVGGDTMLGGTAGAALSPAWLRLNVSSGNVTINSGGALHGYLVAPNSAVMVNGSAQFVGGSVSDRLTVNSGGLLRLATLRPPVVALTSPTPDSVLAAPANIGLAATAAGIDGAITKVEFFRDSTPIGTDTSAPFELVWDNVPAGVYALTARATDANGLSATSAPVPIVVNALPAVALAAPADGSVFVLGAEVVLSAIASDSDGTIAKVEFFAGAAKVGETTGAPHQFAWRPAASGSFTLTARATDNLGLSGVSAAVHITIDSPPAVTLTSPGDGETFVAPATLVLAADASDSDGTIERVEFYRGDALIGTSTTAPYRFTWDNVSAGGYTLTARAIDDLGTGTTSAPATITVNAPPTIALATSPGGPVFAAPATILLTAAAADSDGSVVRVEFREGATLLGEDATAPYEFAWNNVAAGNYSVTATAFDDRGAAATTAPLAVSVDTRPEAIAQTVTLGANGAAAVTLSGFDADGEALSYAIVASPQHGVLSGMAPDLVYTATAAPAQPDAFTFKVSDGRLESEPAIVTIEIPAPTGPPTALPASAYVERGGSVEVTLIGTDAAGGALTFALVSSPTLGAFTHVSTSGDRSVWTYTAGTTAGIDDFSFTVANGAYISEPAMISVAVLPPAPETTGPTGTAGGVVRDAATNEPLAGAIVQIDGREDGIVTDESGRFSMPADGFGEAPGKRVKLAYRAPGYVTSYRAEVVYPGVPVTVDPVFLKKVDPKETPVGSAGGTATNSTGDVVAEFPVGATDRTLPVHLTRYDFGRELPGFLPKSSQFTYAVDLAPDGATFSAPVTVKVANSLGFAPGTPIPVGVFNPQTVRWEHESMAEVSADGAWVVFQVMHFSARDINVPVSKNAPAPGPEQNSNQQNETTPEQVQRDPGVSIADGGYETTLNLPSYRSLEQTRGVQFVYNSVAGSGLKPHTVSAVQERGFESPVAREFRLDVGGRNYQATFEGEPATEFGTYLGGFAADLKTLPTGLYPYRQTATNLYEANYATTPIFGGSAVEDSGVPAREPARFSAGTSGWMPWVNEHESPFGAGWSLRGLSAVHKGADRARVMVTDGGGGYTVFQKRSSYVRSTRSLNGEDFAPYRIRRDHAGGIIVPNGDQLLRVDSELNKTVLLDLGSSGSIVDAVEAQSGTIYFIVDRDPSPVVNPAVPVRGVYRLRPEAATPELVSAVTAGTPWVLELDSRGGIYVYIYGAGGETGASIWRYDDAGNRTLFQNLFEIGKGWGWSEGMVYDHHADRLLIWVDSEIWQKPRMGEVAPFYVSETVDVAWYPIPIVDPMGNVWFIEDDFRARTLNVVKAAPDGTILDRSVTPGSGSVPFPQVSFSRVWAWEFSTLGELWMHHWSFGSTTNTFGPAVHAPSKLFATNGTYEEIEEDATGWTWRDAYGNSRRYDSDGRLRTETDRDGNQTTYGYDAEARLTQIVDPVGAVTTFTYDGRGKLSAVADPAGRTTEFTIDAANHLTRVTLPGGDRHEFAYNPSSHLVRKTDPRGLATTFTVDAQGHYTAIEFADGTDTSFTAQRVAAAQASDPVPGVDRGFEPNLPTPVVGTEPDRILDSRGESSEFKLDHRGYVQSATNAAGITRSLQRDHFDRITKRRDGRGLTTEIKYDEYGNVTSVLLPDGVGLTSYEYDPLFHLLTKRIDPMGRTTTYTRDANGRITRITDAAGKSSTFTYNARGQMTGWADPLGHGGSVAHDLRGNVRSVTNALGQTTTYETDAAGRVTRVTDPNGKSSHYGYDDRNRLVSATAADGGVTTYTYDGNGNRITTRDPVGNVTRFEYDASDKLVKLVAADGTESHFEYDGAGSLTANTNALGHTTRYTYDGIGRLIAIVDPLGRTTRMAYDGNGNVVRVTDAQNRVTTREYDELNRLVKSTAPDGGETRYTYDLVGNLLSVVDPLGRTTQMEYDALNRLTKQTDPLGRFQTFQYDDASRLASRANARGQVMSFTYDDVNRPASLNIAGIDTVSWTYDAAGNPIAISDSDSHTQVVYDDAYRPVQVQQTYGTTQYAYDLAGRRTQRSTSVGSVGYEYDVLHRLKRLSDWAGRSYDFTYDAAGRLVRHQNPNGTFSTFSYDLANQLTEKIHGSVAGQIGENTYVHSLAGKVEGWGSSDGNTRAMSYDPNDRLLGAFSAQPSTPTENFTYDRVGNRTTAGAFVYNAANELIEDASYTYAYDADGNLIERRSKTIAGDVTTYAWDPLNRLVGVVTPTATVTYRHDAMGHRIAKVVNGIETRYVFDGENVAEERDATGALRAANLHAGLDQLLMRDDRGATATFWFHSDHLGSIEALTDAAGAVVERYRYSAFGRLDVLDAGFAATGATAGLTPFAFAGREWEPEVGMYFNRARFYAPELGRFISRDPLGFGGGDVNFYSYTGNSPFTFTDPLGLFLGTPLTAGEWFGAAFSGAGEGLYYAGKGLVTAPYRLGQGVVAGYTQIGEFIGETIVDPGQLARDLALMNANQWETAKTAAGVAYDMGREMVQDLACKMKTSEGRGEIWGDFAFGTISGGLMKRVPAAERPAKIFCFPAGTEVLMADGTSKPIEEIREGDEVLTDSPGDEDGAVAGVVTHVHANWTERLVSIAVDRNGDGEVDGDFSSTGEHPIWTRARGWVHAEDLAVGDELMGALGDAPVVVAVSSAPVVTATFNLTVEGNHTFFVLAGATPVLVHNTNPGNRLYIVYSAPMADGSVYVGRASKAGDLGSLTGQDVLEYRFKGGHHRGIDFSKATVHESIWGGGARSGAYDAIRGAEQLYYENAVKKGVAADQIAPIRANNPNAARYLEAAREMGATPCP